MTQITDTESKKTPAASTEVDTNLLTHDNKVFIRWLEISEASTMQRFQRDLEVMRNHSARVVQLAQRIEQAVTPNEKDVLSKARDTELQNYRKNDAEFELVYKTKTDDWILRPHFLQNTKIRLLSPVTDDIIDKLRKGPDFKESDIVARGNQKLIMLSTVEGDQIPLLERNLRIVQAQQTSLIQLRASEQTAADADAKKRVVDEIEKVTKSLQTNAELMLKTYGIFTNDIVVENLGGILWVALLEEELKRYVEKRESSKGAKPAAAAAAPAPIAPKFETVKTEAPKPKKA
jgi:cell division protein FtsB